MEFKCLSEGGWRYKNWDINLEIDLYNDLAPAVGDSTNTSRSTTILPFSDMKNPVSILVWGL